MDDYLINLKKSFAGLLPSYSPSQTFFQILKRMVVNDRVTSSYTSNTFPASTICFVTSIFSALGSSGQLECYQQLSPFSPSLNSDFLELQFPMLSYFILCCELNEEYERTREQICSLDSRRSIWQELRQLLLISQQQKSKRDRNGTYVHYIK